MNPHDEIYTAFRAIQQRLDLRNSDLVMAARIALARLEIECPAPQAMKDMGVSQEEWDAIPNAYGDNPPGRAG